MFGSSTLDVAIGLIFVYLMLGLTVTAINEGIATVWRLRAKSLERGILRMLQGNKEMAEEFFAHPLIGGMAGDKEKPSYVPSNTFAAVLLHLVRDLANKSLIAKAEKENKPLDTDAVHAAVLAKSGGLATFDELLWVIQNVEVVWLRRALIPLLETARSDVTHGITALEKFSDEIESWFNQSMDRVGGWYKRNTQRTVVIISAFLVAMLNADTITISQQLARDGTLRASIVETAKQASAPPKEAPDASLEERIKTVQTRVGDLKELGIPLGWPDTNFSLKRVPSKVMGLLLTVFAASLGAPFWFDVLNKFMSIRGAGKAPEEKPKNPKRVPGPVTVPSHPHVPPAAAAPAAGEKG